MKRLRNFFISGFFLLSALSAAPANWQQTLDSLRDKTVLIEYYADLRSRENMEGRERVKKHLSGFVVNAEGLIITSANIFPARLEFSGGYLSAANAQKPSHIRVKFEGQEYQAAEFIGKDEDTGLAFIRLKKKGRRPFLKFSENTKPALGSRVLIVQHLPQNYDFQMILRQRRVNALLQQPQPSFLCEGGLVPALSDFGLVLNAQGRAIGLLQSSGSSFHPFDGRSLARFIIFKQFKNFINKPPLFKKKKTVRKKWLGVYSQPFTRQMALYFKHKNLKGILVNTVIEESPAAKAGLQPGDILVALDGKGLSAEKLSDLDNFRRFIREKTDNRVQFKIYRQGRYLQKTVELGETPISQFLADEASSKRLGFSAKELTQDIILAKQLDFDTQGVWVSGVERAGWADVAGLRVGDLILKMDDKNINKLNDLKQLFKLTEKEKPNYISLFIKRNSQTRFLFVKTDY